MDDVESSSDEFNNRASNLSQQLPLITQMVSALLLSIRNAAANFESVNEWVAAVLLSIYTMLVVISEHRRAARLNGLIRDLRHAASLSLRNRDQPAASLMNVSLGNSAAGNNSIEETNAAEDRSRDDDHQMYNSQDLTEKAFLKQPGVFLSSKKTGKGKRPGKGGNRYWKSIGLGFKTPREATEGAYIDKKCPFTGTVSIRGRILAGTCHSAKMTRTIIVRRNYLHFVKKYQRYEKRHSNIAAHASPCFRVKEGDHVIIGQCRPLSKTVRFNVLKVIPAGSGGGKKAFTGM
nr:40S ribosomal protein S11-like [Ipomoea batatas]